MRSAALSLLALCLASCLGAPDRLEVGTGLGGGDIVDPAGRAWEDDTSWVSASLSFPITYDKPWRAEPPPEMPDVAISEQSAPWWEDLATVQNLVILLAGGAAAAGARPGYRKVKTLVKKEKRVDAH